MPVVANTEEMESSQIGRLRVFAASCLLLTVGERMLRERSVRSSNWESLVSWRDKGFCETSWSEVCGL